MNGSTPCDQIVSSLAAVLSTMGIYFIYIHIPQLRERPHLLLPGSFHLTSVRLVFIASIDPRSAHRRPEIRSLICSHRLVCSVISLLLLLLLLPSLSLSPFLLPPPQPVSLLQLLLRFSLVPQLQSHQFTPWKCRCLSFKIFKTFEFLSPSSLNLFSLSCRFFLKVLMFWRPGLETCVSLHQHIPDVMLNARSRCDVSTRTQL